MSGEGDPHGALRAALLAAALPRVAREGWTRMMLMRAAQKARISEAEVHLALPEGVRDLLAAWSQTLDEAMAARLSDANVASLKIRERIALGIRARLEAMTGYEVAAERAAATLALPPFAALGLKLTFETVDRLWRLAGDQATDFNFYSKRALAAGVYVSTLVVWFRDRSPDKAETWRHLARRIDDVMVIEGAKVQFKRFGAYFPAPWPILGALRYAERKARPADGSRSD